MIKHNRRVYIDSPYTVGDVAVNVKTQLDVANELADLRYFPFAPLLFHFQHMAHPRPYFAIVSTTTIANKLYIT